MKQETVSCINHYKIELRIFLRAKLLSIFSRIQKNLHDLNCVPKRCNASLDYFSSNFDEGK